MPPREQRALRLDATARPSRAARTRRLRRRRKLLLLLATAAAAVVLGLLVSGAFSSSHSFRAPSAAALRGLSLRQRIVAIANSQVGYSTRPHRSYCNKFSAYWQSGKTGCPSGEAAEEWCADFAAWAWQKAGLPVTYGYEPGEINAGAVSFYEWGVANGHWHPAGSGYVAQPGDVAVYGLELGEYPTAAHVAIVTEQPAGQHGPDVINGDGDQTGFSVVETGSDQTQTDDGHHAHALLAGYVTPA